jgi:multicomponent Na+:H+ antiporter subunit D
VSAAWLVPAPVLLPLLGAALSLFAGRWPAAQRVLGLGVVTAVVVVAAELLRRADGGGPLAVQAGGFAAPAGITLVADRLAALALLTSAAVTLVVLVYAVGQGVAEQREVNAPSVFHPTYLTLVAGIALAFLSGDLFTLFVGFEVMLSSSYVLITLGATAERVRAGMTYTVVSLTASLLLLSSIGLVYAVTGTVNLADLSVQTAQVPAGLRTFLSVMLLVVLGTKAAMVPLHLWLPDSYPTAPAPVTAVFAALLTKVGVYAVVRTQTLLFPREGTWDLLLVLAGATMVVGILGALVQDDVNRLLSFALVSHIGYMLLGLGLSSTLGLAGTVYYLVHHITVQAGLFLVVGLVERERGTSSLSRLGGLVATAPLLSAMFLLPALSLAGVPPFAGFVGKLVLLQAAVETGGVLALTLAVAVLVASLLTLAAVARLWARAYWGPVAPPVPDQDVSDRVQVATHQPAPAMQVAAGAAVVIGLVVAGASGPLGNVSQRAAIDLLARTPYQQAVLGPTPATDPPARTVAAP